MAGGILSNLKIGVIFKVPVKPIQTVNEKLKSMKDRAVEAGGGFDGLKGKFVGFLGIGGNVGEMVDGLSDAFFGQAEAFQQMATQTGAAGQQLEGMKKAATDLYRQGFGSDWSDITDTMTLIKQNTNLVGDALQDATKDALVLRDKFKMDPEETIKTADTMMKNFGISSEQAFSLLIQGQQKGLNKSGDMLDTINEYAVQFKQLGFDANGMFDTLAAGAQNGAFNLDKVGDAIKEFGLRVKDGSGQGAQAMSLWLGKGKANEYMKAFAKGGEGARRAFTEVVQQLNQVQDASKRNYLATQLFGTQYEDLQQNVIAAFADVPKQFDAMNNAMDQASVPKFSQSVKSLGRSVQMNLIGPIGTKLAPLLTEFGGWMEHNQGTVKVLSMVIGGLALGIGALTAVTYTFAAAQAVAGMAVSTWNTLVRISSVATKAWSAAQWVLNAAMTANPIGLIVVGIAALVAGIVIAYKKVGWFRDAINSLWEGMKAGGAMVGNAVTDAWNGVKGVVLGGINWAIGKINSVIKNINSVTDKIPKSLGGGSLQIPLIPEVGGDTDGSHRSGLASVPFDGYRAELHKGEAVLTKRQNDAYRQGLGGVGGIEVHVHVAGTNASANDIGDAVKKALAEYFASAMRREGLTNG